MNKREKRLVTFLVVMVVIAVAYNIFRIISKNDTNEQNVVDLEKVQESIDKLDLAVDGIKVSKFDRYVMQRSERKWGADPFLLNVLSDALGEDDFVIEMSKSSEFVYSGYVIVGRQRMAVIDGLEYAVGDELDQGGIIVREIQRSNIVLEVSEFYDTGTGNAGEGAVKMTIKRIIVPIAE